MTFRHGQRGFTLGETMTTLAVVGIGLSLAVPGTQALVESNRQATAVNELVATMHLARSEALTRNRPVLVCASADGEHCGNEHWERGWIAFLDENHDGARDPGDLLLDAVGALPGQELSSSEFPRAFSYRPNGRAMGATPQQLSGEFAFCEPGADAAARVVIVRPNGLPALAEKRRDGSLAPCRTSGA